MVYSITYYEIGKDGCSDKETHECNWMSEVNVIVGNGLEKGYIVMVEKIKKE